MHEYRRRSFLGFVLMLTQAFFYNAIFFTYALVLMRFYNVPEQNVGSYLLPFALGNVLGPAVARASLRHNRTQENDHCYLWTRRDFTRADRLAFSRGRCSPRKTQTLAWTIIFFIASAAASSAYLTVSEIFPLEIRALAIAIFYAIGTLAGGVGAPLLFGWIIGTGSITALFIGYLSGSGADDFRCSH